MSISFARVAGTSTTMAGTNVYSAYAPPTATAAQNGQLTGQDISDYYLKVFFTKPYLDAHTLSFPSWRYAYIFWFILIFLFLVWTIMHQLHWRAGFIGAAYRKFAMRKLTFGKKPPPRSSIGTAAAPAKRRRNWTSMTISQFTGLVLLTAFTFVMCYVGPDYVQPRECMFGGECGYVAVNGDNATNQFSRKRAVQAAATAGFNRLAKRRHARYAWSVLTDPLLSAPNFTIDKNYWASANRVGLIGYAFLPLSVGLALKQWPMNPFAAPFFTNLGIDKTVFWHRWIGRLVWVLSTVHTGLWTKQLFTDLNPFNEPTFYTSFKWHRLMAGAVAYGFLTAMVAFSFKPLRNRYYELFYYSHVVLTLGFLVGIIIHYQALQGWGLLAASLWGLERLVRFGVYVYLNYGSGMPIYGEGSIGRSQFTSRGARDSGFKVHTVEKRLSAEGQRYAAANAGNLSTNPYGNEEWSAASRSTQNLQDSLAPVSSQRQPVYAYGSGNNGSTMALPSSGAFDKDPLRQSSPAPHAVGGPSAILSQLHRTQPIPRGYALAQILPGKVIKLTLHTPRHLNWKPGQHIQLTIPSVRWWQSHPYSICNSQDMTERLLSRRPDGEDKAGSEVVLLMSVRRGFTKHLYDSLVSKRKRLVSSSHSYSSDKTSGSHQTSEGVLIRAQTYLPTGSAARAHWHDFSTVVLVAAGTGITYSLSVLEDLCFQMAKKDAALRGDEPSWARSKGKRKQKPTNVSRVRFVWIMREYSHLAWIAPALRRCLDIADPARLRVDLFVTRELARIPQGPSFPQAYSPYPTTDNLQYTPGFEQSNDDFKPPVPGFARHARTGSADSSMSDLSRTVVDGRDYPNKQNAYDGGQSQTGIVTTQPNETADFSITDMVLFDGEEDLPTSTADEEMSKNIRKEGKLRRALSRKRTGRMPKSDSRQGLNPQSQNQARTEAETSDDEAGSSTPKTSKPLFSSSHQYPPANSRRGSAYTAYGQSGKDDASGYSTPYGRRASTPGLPLLHNDDLASFDLSEQDKEDLMVIAELARGGHPDLDGIFDQEIEKSQGSVAIGCCGPQTLNNLIRGMVAKRISPSRMLKGDSRGNIELIAEDFAY